MLLGSHRWHSQKQYRRKSNPLSRKSSQLSMVLVSSTLSMKNRLVLELSSSWQQALHREKHRLACT